jgi:hypothetical protein
MTTIKDGLYFIRSVEGKDVLHVDSSTKPYPTVVCRPYEYDSIDDQLFKISHNGTAHIITHKLTGRVFDVRGGATADGTPIITFPLHSKSNQLWNITIRHAISAPYVFHLSCFVQ